MKTLLTVLFIVCLPFAVYAADPFVGYWGYLTDDGCAGQMDVQHDGTFDLWLACYNYDSNCYDIFESFGEWDKISRGLYLVYFETGYAEVIQTGNTAFMSGTALTKRVSIEGLMSFYYENQCVY
jgi:hypothetical protein